MIAKKRKDNSKYYHVTKVEWIPVNHRAHRMMCCDCGKTHDIDFRIDKEGKVEIRVRSNNRATSAARRAFKFTPETEE